MQMNKLNARQIMQYRIFCFYFFILNLIKRCFNLFFPHLNNVQIKTINPVTSYCDSSTKMFLEKYNRENNNLFVNDIFYSKNLFNEMLQDPINTLEKQWKSKLLYQSTPRGNVIMYYDVYKLGFAYYSDQSIPYDVLNAMAMKFVTMFQCRDFFLDEHITPTPSPLLKLLEEDKKAPKEKDEDNRATELKNILKNAPVAKFKNYSKIGGSIVNKEKESENVIETNRIKERNRFIYLGKIINFNILKQEPIKKNSVFSTPSSMNSDLFQNANVQKEVFNYRHFKKMGGVL